MDLDSSLLKGVVEILHFSSKKSLECTFVDHDM